MDNTYTIVNKFDCCGTTMVTVIIHGKAACTMPEVEWKWTYGKWHPERWQKIA